ncbi:hypothetical protein QUF54_02970, partial [Candidatus Marithioploca araucensis]|nr:hypothetical protein [Candidatus Marithioploca araucensis]
MKSARWRRAIEVAGPCPFGTRTADAGRPEPNGAILWAKSKNGREAIFASSLTRDNPHYHKRDVVHLAIIILFIFGFTLMSVVVRDFLSEVQIEPWEQRYFYLQQKFFLIAFVIVVYLAIKQYKRMQIVGIIVALSIGLLLNIHNYVYKYP